LIGVLFSEDFMKNLGAKITLYPKDIGRIPDTSYRITAITCMPTGSVYSLLCLLLQALITW
jgi:hypothetical protein